jgi:hypothetical protein
MGGSDAMSIFPTDLYGRLGMAGSPLLFDVRRAAAFEADETLIVGALRNDPEGMGAWQPELPRDRPGRGEP